MAHDDQFTATGPPFTGSGVPRSSFSSGAGAASMVYGVNVQGATAGLYAESVTGESTRESHLPHGIGAYGVGDVVGVFGRNHQAPGIQAHAGVIGQHNNAGVGTIGAALTRGDRGGIGVAGISHTSVSPPVFESLPDPAAGSGVGVYGTSGSGAGVRGTSARGPGVEARSGEGAAIVGRSGSGRGAVLESGGTAAQLGLVPQPMDTPGVRPAAPVQFDSTVLESLPDAGNGGDLLATRGQDGRCTLWFCTRGQAAETPAEWSQVLLATPLAARELEFADWTSVSENVAHGTLHGSPLSLSGTKVDPPPGSVLDGTFPLFNRSHYTPPLPASDAIHFVGGFGNSYTLTFAAPVTDPVLHLASLGSTLHFPEGTRIAGLSGDAQFSVSGSSVIGQAESPQDDANGTAVLSGTFASITFSTTNSFGGPDGIFIQVGAER
ncbi:MAG TPA: hypothetical protein VHF89_00670 [Solirubrobacteraceae bacterium]|nr:hypothetical protein [Solirubrobacteraceae bacterium]